MGEANDIETEAMQWLLRLEAVDPAHAPELQAQLEEWCNADTRRHAAYIRLSQAWRKADQLKRLASNSGVVDPDLLASADVPRTSRRSVWRGALAAAAAVITIGAGTWLAAQLVWGQAYATPIGGYQRVLLADGSIVELDTDSRIRVRLSKDGRRITLLKGQANFHVARDTRRPFEVRVHAATVRALGTVFSVRLGEERRVEVTVTEGRIAVDTPDSAVAVAGAGEAVVIQPIASVHTIRKESVAIARDLSWTQGRLSFEGETLREAIAEFNRYNRRKLTIADPSIEGIRVGGSFQPTDPQSFVMALQRSFGVDVRSSDGEEIVLVKAAE